MTYNPGHHPMRATAKSDITVRINDHHFLGSDVGIALNYLSQERTGNGVHIDSYPGEVEALQFLNEGTSESSAPSGQLEAELRQAVERQEYAVGERRPD